MHQDKCVELARDAAVDCDERHTYMPTDAAAAADWHPHRWVVDAMLLAADVAERERDQFKAGNTSLLQALMLAHEDRDTAAASRVSVLREAGMLNDDGTCNWQALEDRKPKQVTWAQAVNECVTDPAARARLLALDDNATTDQVHSAVRG